MELRVQMYPLLHVDVVPSNESRPLQLIFKSRALNPRSLLPNHTHKKIESHERAYKEFPFNKLVEFGVLGLVDSQVDLLVPVLKKGGMCWAAKGFPEYSRTMQGSKIALVV